jgi:GAF domain-containing protein
VTEPWGGSEAVGRRAGHGLTRASIAPWARCAEGASRRVAVFVVHATNPSDRFSAVAEEIARCLRVRHAALARYAPSEMFTVVAVYDRAGAEKLAMVEYLQLGGDNITTRAD